MIKQEYAVSATSNDEDWGFTCMAESREDAARQFCASPHGIGIGDTLFVGPCYRPCIETFTIDADSFIQDIIDGSEFSEWLDDYPDATSEQWDELERQLNDVFHAWCHRHEIHPGCWSVEGYDTIPVDPAWLTDPATQGGAE